MLIFDVVADLRHDVVAKPRWICEPFLQGELWGKSVRYPWARETRLESVERFLDIMGVQLYRTVWPET